MWAVRVDAGECVAHFGLNGNKGGFDSLSSLLNERIGGGMPWEMREGKENDVVSRMVSKERHCI